MDVMGWQLGVLTHGVCDQEFRFLPIQLFNYLAQMSLLFTICMEDIIYLNIFSWLFPPYLGRTPHSRLLAIKWVSKLPQDFLHLFSM
jgi:hypothetical protein